MTDGVDELRGVETVERWVANTSDDTVAPEWLRGRLAVLAGFLASVGKKPDELVAFCFLRKKDTGERFVSTKRRAEVNEMIEAYVVERGWVGKEAVANGNVIRSFLIHNGVPIGGRTWVGG